MRAYVINLESSTERRLWMETQLRRVGLPYELVEAVDGKSLGPVERAKLLDEQHAKDPGWMSPGVIGCALSHLAVYHRIIDSDDEIALVLEDDAVLPDDIAGLTERMSGHMRGREVLLLYFRSFKPCRLSEQNAVSVGGCRLLYPMDVFQPGASTAYLVSRSAARSLAEVVLPLRGLAADSWGHYYTLGALESLRCTFPRPIGANSSLESTLGYGDDARRHGGLKHQTLWPIPQIRALNRRRISRNMTRVTLVRAASQQSREPNRAGLST